MPALQKRFRSRSTYREKAPRTTLYRASFVGHALYLYIKEPKQSYKEENPGTAYFLKKKTANIFNIWSKDEKHVFFYRTKN